ncbi:DUF305 domain-containing protein [Aromatoleum aromaticum]|nr:DUF305 domain-containing protein [Aromatoleum aromaticum]
MKPAKAVHEALRSLCQQIIAAQQAADMQTWLQAWYELVPQGVWGRPRHPPDTMMRPTIPAW